MSIRFCDCGGRTHVTDSREHTDGFLYRRRACRSCGQRISTYEVEPTAEAIAHLTAIFENGGPHFGRPQTPMPPEIDDD